MLFMSCVCHAFASVHCCIVVTCWERAELLTFDSGVKIVFLSLSHVVSWDRCGNFFYCIDS